LDILSENIIYLSLSVVFSFFDPLSFSPKGAVRLKIAWQAILAKAPDCRVDHRSTWPLPKISQRADFLTVGPLPPCGNAGKGVIVISNLKLLW